MFCKYGVFRAEEVKKKKNNTWNLTGFWKTEGPPEDLYSARKLFWDTTLWLRDGIWSGRKGKRGVLSDRGHVGAFTATLGRTQSDVEAYPSLVGLTERKAWTMSALMELSGLSWINTKICSSFSRLMKLPNQDLLANLQKKQVFDMWQIASIHK